MLSPSPITNEAFKKAITYYNNFIYLPQVLKNCYFIKSKKNDTNIFGKHQDEQAFKQASRKAGKQASRSRQAGKQVSKYIYYYFGSFMRWIS